VNESVFEKIVDSTTAKEAWDILTRCYGGENLNMKNNEKVFKYIFRVILITNKMKACGETLSE
jgi:hypothetical protein